QRASDFLTSNFQSSTGAANTSTIQIGRWSESTKTFTVTATKPNAVRVTATRNDAPLFFAAIFGSSHYNLTRSAAAICIKPDSCSNWGLQRVTMAGGATTDSYDSSAGAYDSAFPGDDGNVCSCHNIGLNGSPTIINGEAFYGSGYAFSTTGQ